MRITIYMYIYVLIPCIVWLLCRMMNSQRIRHAAEWPQLQQPRSSNTYAPILYLYIYRHA